MRWRPPTAEPYFDKRLLSEQPLDFEEMRLQGTWALVMSSLAVRETLTPCSTELRTCRRGVCLTQKPRSGRAHRCAFECGSRRRVCQARSIRWSWNEKIGVDGGDEGETTRSINATTLILLGPRRAAARWVRSVRVRDWPRIGSC